MRAVIFDMDGVIFDSEKLYFRAESEYLARRGQIMTHEISRAMMGLPSIPAIEVFKRMTGIREENETILVEMQGLFEALLERDLACMPGLQTLLSGLEKRALPRSVATSTHRELAHRMLRQHGLLERFHFVLTVDDVSRGKPDPEIYLASCERLGVPPREALVIEDSITGATAAKAAGCVVVAMPGDKSWVSAYHFADEVIDHLLDPKLLSLCGLHEEILTTAV